MTTSFANGEKSNKDNNENDVTAPVQAESQQESCECDPLPTDAQTSLLAAQENAISAKEAAMEAINRVYKESEASAQTLAKTINEAMQYNAREREEFRDAGSMESSAEDHKDNPEPGTLKDQTKPRLIHKFISGGHNSLNNLFSNKAMDLDSGKKEESRHPVEEPSGLLRQLIENLTEGKAQSKSGETMGEANTSRIETKKASDEVQIVRKAAEEAISLAREETIKAKEEAEMARRTVEIAISKAKQEAISKVADDIIKAKEEVRAAKEAANMAIRQARDDSNRSKEEVEAANNHAQVAITLAQEKVKATVEEVESIKRQSQLAASQAQDEVLRLRGEIETIKRMANEAISRAEEESRQAKEEAEASMLRSNETMALAQQHIISMTKAEIARTRQEIEAASKNPGEVFSRIPEVVTEGDSHLANQDKVTPGHVAAILYEMHAPLHSICGFARLMLEGDISDSTTMKEFLSIIFQQSESLCHQLDDLSGTLNHSTPRFTQI
jgi:hypothetical protein